MTRQINSQTPGARSAGAPRQKETARPSGSAGQSEWLEESMPKPLGMKGKTLSLWRWHEARQNAFIQIRTRQHY